MSDPSGRPAAYVSRDLRLDAELHPGGSPRTPTIMLGRVQGDVDARSAADFRAWCAGAADPGPLVLDLSDVTFLGVAGLSALVDLAHDLRRRGVDWAVAAQARAVLRPLAVSGLPDLVPVHPTVRAAMDSLTGPRPESSAAGDPRG
ncbi:STAS domain-containing protein [Amycolatopsis antarctica]|uniref:STAS domain-containing protein n=1 Tax=Amycolatopsis antarctica TaxID=1854586 RepID=UPI0010541962|nr:STAS domain-containing protein [Amycolatopsis antarctica]